MPRESKRALAIRSSAELLNHRLMLRFLRAFYGSDDENEDEDNDTDSALFLRHQYLQSSCYCCARQYRPRESRFWWYTHACCDREFLRCFRMCRASFYKLLQLVAPNAVFTNIPGKRKMAPPHQQLLVFLKYVGTLGSDSCVENLGTLFGVSSGVSFSYINRVTAALLELYETVVAWPDPSERAAIAERVKSGYDFPNCVGMVDRTLLPLAFRPARNGEDYFTRKGGYAMNCLICCDDQAKVTYALIGWPGSTHDNRLLPLRLCLEQHDPVLRFLLDTVHLPLF